MALTNYLRDTRTLLGTAGASNLFTDAQLTVYINRARGQIAIEGECIRALTPISAPITSITIGSGGTGYTSSPIVTVSQPDSPSGTGTNFSGLQATAVAVRSGTAVSAITITNPGDGYFQPVVTISSGGGQGATATAVVANVNATLTNKEVYNFSDVNALVATSGSGISSIYNVLGISMIWSTFRYTLMHWSFQKYQAKARNYTFGYQYIPAVWAQYAQGVKGSVYTYPISNQPYQMEWDCMCIPNDVNTDTDFEAIPYPWTDCVPYFAAYFAFMQATRNADADRMMTEFEKFMKRARKASSGRVIESWYGRS